jgi:hypothetical protein
LGIAGVDGWRSGWVSCFDIWGWASQVRRRVKGGAYGFSGIASFCVTCPVAELAILTRPSVPAEMRAVCVDT